jgi:hypothetical protein
MWESLLTILNSQNSKGISTLYLQKYICCGVYSLTTQKYIQPKHVFHGFIAFYVVLHIKDCCNTPTKLVWLHLFFTCFYICGDINIVRFCIMRSIKKLSLKYSFCEAVFRCFLTEFRKTLYVFAFQKCF